MYSKYIVTRNTTINEYFIKLAYKSGMLDDEELWLEALRDRNSVVHSYSDEIAKQIIDASKNKYIALLDILLRELRANWMCE